MADYIQRQGKYHYSRIPGVPRQRLRGEIGSPEYVAHLQELLYLAQQAAEGTVLLLPNARRSVGRPLSRANTPPAGSDLRKIFLPGSIGWAIERFVTHPSFITKYKPGTREGHRLCLDMVRTDMGAGMLADLDRAAVRHYCSRIADRGTTARADQVRRCMSLLWQFALKHLPVCKINEERPNPARGIEAYHEVRKPHAKWPPHVQKAFLAGAPDHLRLAYYLARYTAFRRGDLCSIKWSQYDEEGERPTLYVETEKTGEYVPMFVLPELQALLAATERRSETILCDAQGRPVSKHTLSAWVAKRLRSIGIKGLTLHGLRKTLATERAENGAGVQGLMALLGHKNPKQALYYVHEADKAQLIYDAMTVRRPKQPAKLAVVGGAS
jgi:integrase